MKLTYGITFEDFASLFPPQSSVRKPKPGLYFAMVMSGLLGLVGILILLKAIGVIATFGVPVGTVAEGAGTAAVGMAIIAYCVFRERHLDAKLRKNYEAGLLAQFKSLHCPDSRCIELMEDGVETSCKCGVLKRPWSEIRAFSENPRFFSISARQETHLVPKRAFGSESERTEFRSLFDTRIHVAPILSGTRVQYVYTKADSRNARMLHLRNGLSSKKKAELVFTAILLTAAFVYVYRTGALGPNFAIALGVVLLLAFSRLLPVAKWSKNRYFGPLSASFSSDGIQIQDSTTTALYRWDEFRGYTKDSAYWLLYHNNNKYRVLPRRAFQLKQAAEFNSLIEAHLRPIASVTAK